MQAILKESRVKDKTRKQILKNDRYRGIRDGIMFDGEVSRHTKNIVKEEFYKENLRARLSPKL